MSNGPWKTDGMNQLHAAITALSDRIGVVGAVAAAGFNKAAVQARIDRERAAMRLAAVCPPEHRERVWAEVARRKELMGERAALESVWDDLVRARWRL